MRPADGLAAIVDRRTAAIANHGFDEPLAGVVGARHRERDWWLRRVLAAADAFAFVLAALGAIASSGHLGLVRDGPWLLAFLPVWIVLCWVYRLYDRDTRKVSHGTVDDMSALFHASLVAAVTFWAVSRLLPATDLTVGELSLLSGGTVLGSIAARSTARAVARHHFAPERVLFVGGGPSAAALAARMQSGHAHRLQPVGMLSRSSTDGMERLGIPTVGTFGELPVEDIFTLLSVDRVVVDDNLNDERILALLHQCQGNGVKLDLVPALFGALGPAVEVDHVGGLTMLSVNPPLLSRSDRVAKRVTDVVGSSLILLLAFPLFVLIPLAIKLTSRGPVLFRQERVGRGGRHFRLVKFRSMRTDAESMRAGLMAQSKDAGWLHLDHDPRVTRVGRFLRATSMDELPQLWNVLRGDMSLVGPRPLILEEDSNVNGWARGRLDLTPGITGLWQVLGRTTIPFEEMVKLDYLYVTNWSLWQDVRLMLQTLPAVLFRRGAN